MFKMRIRSYTGQFQNLEFECPSCFKMITKPYYPEDLGVDYGTRVCWHCNRLLPTVLDLLIGKTERLDYYFNKELPSSRRIFSY